MSPAPTFIYIFILVVLQKYKAEAMCGFHDGRVLCSNMNFTEVPKEITVKMNPNEIIRLDLSNNFINTLTIDSLSGFVNLKELIIVNSKLHEVNVGVFDSLEELNSLDLSDNYISSVSTSTLARCTKLENISLANNLIETLDEFNVTEFSNLRYLDVSNNRLTFLPLTVLQYLLEVNDFTIELSNNPWNCDDPDWANNMEVLNLTKVFCSDKFEETVKTDDFEYRQLLLTKDDPEEIPPVQKGDSKIVLWIIVGLLLGIIIGNTDRIYKTIHSKFNKSRRNVIEKTDEDIALKEP